MIVRTYLNSCVYMPVDEGVHLPDPIPIHRLIDRPGLPSRAQEQ